MKVEIEADHLVALKNQIEQQEKYIRDLEREASTVDKDRLNQRINDIALVMFKAAQKRVLFDMGYTDTTLWGLDGIYFRGLPEDFSKWINSDEVEIVWGETNQSPNYHSAFVKIARK